MHVFQLPEMASRVEVVPFDPDDIPGATALGEYAELLRGELAAESFA